MLDPWLFTYAKEINEQGFGLKVPFSSVSTEHFHPFCSFNSRETLENLIKNSKNHHNSEIVQVQPSSLEGSHSIEDIEILRVAHLHQCDLISLIPLEMYLAYASLP